MKSKVLFFYLIAVLMSSPFYLFAASKEGCHSDCDKSCRASDVCCQQGPTGPTGPKGKKGKEGKEGEKVKRSHR